MCADTVKIRVQDLIRNECGFVCWWKALKLKMIYVWRTWRFTCIRSQMSVDENVLFTWDRHFLGLFSIFLARCYKNVAFIYQMSSSFSTDLSTQTTRILIFKSFVCIYSLSIPGYRLLNFFPATKHRDSKKMKKRKKLNIFLFL